MRLSPIRVRTLPRTRTTQPIWLDNFPAADKILAATIAVRQSSSRFRPLLMGGFTWPHKTAWWFTDCFNDAGLVTFCQSKEVGQSPREPATSIAESKLGAFPFIRRPPAPPGLWLPSVQLWSALFPRLQPLRIRNKPHSLVSAPATGARVSVFYASLIQRKLGMPGGEGRVCPYCEGKRYV